MWMPQVEVTHQQLKAHRTLFVLRVEHGRTGKVRGKRVRRARGDAMDQWTGCRGPGARAALLLAQGRMGCEWTFVEGRVCPEWQRKWGENLEDAFPNKRFPRDLCGATGAGSEG